MNPTTVAIHKILVPTDFTECSREAARFAADLARRYNASITLVHVDESSDPGGYDDALDAATRDPELDGAPRIDSRLLHGDPFSEIVGLAGDGDYGLIVMGTRGRRTHPKVSITGAVVRNAPCPVMTVKTAGYS